MIGIEGLGDSGGRDLNRGADFLGKFTNGRARFERDEAGVSLGGLEGGDFFRLVTSKRRREEAGGVPQM